MKHLGLALLPGVIAWLAIAAVLHTSWVKHLWDHPNERSLHSVPTPRIGGIGILAGTLALAILQPVGALAAILGCAFLLWCVGLVDDLRSLPVRVRLSAHGLAAFAAMWAVSGPPGDPASALPWFVAVVAITWGANLFNFMDGADGLAGGMSALGFAFYAVAAASAQESMLASTALVLASASAGFLLHNFPPARAFLGDSGSIPLGFLAGALGAYGVACGAWPWVFPVLVFSPFIVDATVTLLHRIVRGEAFLRAHRTHYYQRLVLAGWSHRRLAVCAYGLMLAAGASALVLRSEGPLLQCGIILGWSAAYSLALYAIDRKTTRNPQAAP